MKKRMLALLLALAMVLSLTACGDKEDSTENKTLAQELGYGYLSEYSDLTVELDWINSARSTNGKLYISGEYYGDDYGYSTKLYEIDPATGATTAIPVPELENSENVNEYVQNLFVCEDGSGYWMLIDHYEFSVDGSYDDYGVMPADAVAVEEIEEDVLHEDAADGVAIDEVEDQGDVQIPEEGLGENVQVTQVETMVEGGAVVDTIEESTDDFVDEAYTYEEPQEYYLAKKMDMSGNVVTEVDLTECTKNLDYFYPQYFVQDGDGNLVIFSSEKLLILGGDGGIIDIIDMENQWVQSMAVTGNGTVVASFYSSEEQKYVACRVNSEGLSDPIDITGFPETSSLNLYAGDGDTLLLNDGDNLYSLDTNTGVATKLLSWLDSDINGGNLTGIGYDGSDKIMVLLTDWGRNGTTYEMGTLTKTPVEEIPERTILTLGGTYLGDELKDAVIAFNRTNDTYRITFVDYGDYNTTEDYTLAEKQLDRDIISGSCPDIISLTTGRQDKYISKGALADLSALMEKDGEVSQDDLLSGPLKAYLSDGKVYGLPGSFYLNTVVASRQLVGDMTEWDMSSFAELVGNLDEDVELMQYTSQEGFLTQMVYQNLGSFVDYGKASCTFDSQDFKDLLAVAACFPTQEELDAANMDESGEVVYYYVDPNEQLQAGELLMSEQYVGDSYSIKSLYNLYNAENGFVRLGFPQTEGNGAVISVSSGLAISSKSKNQEGAWEFLKSTLADDVQLDTWNMPITCSAFQKFVEEAMEQSYYMDGDEKVYYDDMMYIGDTEYTLEPLTQEQVDDFVDYVNGAVLSGNYDTDIIEIVTEEAGAYFAGDKTADEVANLIQNRVTIYLGETS